MLALDDLFDVGRDPGAGLAHMSDAGRSCGIHLGAGVPGRGMEVVHVCVLRFRAERPGWGGFSFASSMPTGASSGTSQFGCGSLVPIFLPLITKAPPVRFTGRCPVRPILIVFPRVREPD